jgi:FkbM family methyltransferase
MRISYAQRMEDFHLDRVFADVPAGTYIDVGGGHPVADNVSFHFYLKGWRGVVIEPQTALARLYASVRPRDTTLEILVGDHVGAEEFHEVEGLHGFSTTVAANAEVAESHGAAIATRTVPMTTLAEICAAHTITSVDFLKIDVEGAEAAVLAGNDWAKIRPRVIVVEAVAPGTMAPAWDAFEPQLLARGYRFAFFDELNRFYVAEEARHLMSRFPSAPADWGGVEHPWDYGRAPDNPRHPDHILARHLVRGLMTLLPGLDKAVLMRLLEAGGALSGTEDEIARRLLGSAADPASADQRSDIAALIDSDRFRAVLGRIAAPYDGGFLMEDATEGG